MPVARALLAALCLTAAAGCTPTVRVQAPTEPITINLNIKIEQEVRIRVEKDLEDLFKSESDLFGGKKQ
ncbi:MAG: YnbE family lipoprotein [Thalassobaculaceae bacterium]|nr:YnbE family lipoprotein [Thalassobaculaceae bacterium]